MMRADLNVTDLQALHLALRVLKVLRFALFVFFGGVVGLVLQVLVGGA